MPIYEYICKECHHQFEALVYGKEKAECPKCHTKSWNRSSRSLRYRRRVLAGGRARRALRILRRSARAGRMLDARHELTTMPERESPDEGVRDLCAGRSAIFSGKRVFVCAAAVDYRHWNLEQPQIHRQLAAVVYQRFSIMVRTTSMRGRRIAPCPLSASATSRWPVAALSPRETALRLADSGRRPQKFLPDSSAAGVQRCLGRVKAVTLQNARQTAGNGRDMQGQLAQRHRFLVRLPSQLIAGYAIEYRLVMPASSRNSATAACTVESCSTIVAICYFSFFNVGTAAMRVVRSCLSGRLRQLREAYHLSVTVPVVMPDPGHGIGQ